MDTKLLEVFLAVVHTGSISAAARRLNFSQPAVSQQMKVLERTMETPLFTRERGRLELTAAGRTLQGYAESTLTSWRFVVEQVREASARDDVTELSLGSFPSANAMLVPDAVSTMLAEDSSLRVKVVDAEPPANFDLLRSAQVDALVTFSYPEDEPARGMVELPVLEEKYVLLVGGKNSLAKEKEVTLDAAATDTWIGGCPKCRQELVTECKEKGFNPEILASTDDPMMTRLFVAKGIGVAMRPALTVLGQSDQGFATVGITGGITRKVSVLVPETEADNPIIQTLHATLKSAATKLVGESPKHHQNWVTVS